MLNVTRWMKDDFKFPENGENLVNSLVELFRKNEEAVERATTGITFKNGSRMVIKMASEAVKDIAKTE